MFTLKLNLRPKIDLTYAITIVKWFFGIFDEEWLFFTVLAEWELLMFHNNIVKISEQLIKRNLLKIYLQVTYPTEFCITYIHFYYGQSETIWF